MTALTVLRWDGMDLVGLVAAAVFGWWARGLTTRRKERA